MKRKDLLVSVALILSLGLGGALAQNINKSLQQSQDPTGAFGVDTNNGVYFPGHILSSGTNRPTPTVTGTGSPTVSGTDTAGLITMGSSATTATVVFGQAFVSVPSCIVQWQSNLASEVYTLATTSIAITQTSTSTNKINYLCFSVS